MPDLVEGLTYIQECCGAVFTVVEGREDGMRDAVGAGWWSGLCGTQTDDGEFSLWPCDQGRFGGG